jgi:hypothetical protein
MEARMSNATRMATGLAAGLLLWTGTALAQNTPPPVAPPASGTPERVEGQVTRIDQVSGKVTLQASNGQTFEFEAPAETLKGLKVGDRIEARLRK